MSDKTLTEGEWKKFAKGRDLKDAALLKELVAYERAKDAEAQLKALVLIGKEVEALRKLVKGDKAFGAQLDAMDKAIDKDEKAAKLAQKEAESKESESEEDEGTELLTAKLVPLLRQVKKGDEMHALVAIGTKTTAVLLSRRPISPSRRRLLTDHLGDGMPKFATGTCLFEANAYTFVLLTQAAGLAKKLRAALLAQTELRLKVRVRGEDPSDIDDDGEPAVEEHEGHEGEGQDAPPQTSGQTSQTQQMQQTQPGTIPPAPPLPDPLKPQFEKRWAVLEVRVLAALKAGTGDVSKIRAVAEFVREKGEAGNYKAALQGADSLEKLLPSGDPGGSVEVTAPTGDDPGLAFKQRLAALMPEIKEAIGDAGPHAQDIKLKASEAGVFANKKEFEHAHALLDEVEALLEVASEEEEPEDEVEDRVLQPRLKVSKVAPNVAFTQARLAWETARKKLRGELEALEASVIEACKEEQDAAAITTGLKRLYDLLAVLDEELIDKLDEALGAEGDARHALHEQAREIVDGYLAYVDSEAMIDVIDANTFHPVQLRAMLQGSLRGIDQGLRDALLA